MIESRSGGIKFPDGTVQTTAFSGSGRVINTYFAIANGGRQTVSSTSPVAVTGLSITLTPVSASSRFVIMSTVNGSMTYVSCSFVYRNGSSVVNQSSNSCGAGALATSYTSPESSGTSNMHQHQIFYIDSPSTTATVTYDIRHMAAWQGSASTTYVNSRDTNDMLTPSTMMILELSN